MHRLFLLVVVCACLAFAPASRAQQYPTKPIRFVIPFPPGDSLDIMSRLIAPHVLERLGRSDASISDLAEKFHMTLTGMKKHVGVLEKAGLVTTKKVGRVRTCRLGLSRLQEEMAWIERYRELWDARFDALDELVEELKTREKLDGSGSE